MTLNDHLLKENEQDTHLIIAIPILESINIFLLYLNVSILSGFYKNYLLVLYTKKLLIIINMRVSKKRAVILNLDSPSDWKKRVIENRIL